MLPSLTNAVHITSIDDLDKVDLHYKYCQVLGAYEALIVERNDERKASDYQLAALRKAMSERSFSTAEKRSYEKAAAQVVELQLRTDRAEGKVPA